MHKSNSILEAIGFSVTALSTGEKLPKKIDQVLQVLGLATEADRAYVFVNSEEPDGSLAMNYEHEWCKEGVDPFLHEGLIDKLPWDYFPETFAYLSAGQSLNDLVANSSNEIFREAMNAQNILSYLFIPIFVDGYFWGYIGLDSSENGRLFSKEEIIGMRAVANTLGNCILTQKKSEEIINSRRNHLADINAISNVIFNLDLNYNLLFINDYWEEFSGYSKEEVIGSNLTGFFVKKEELHEIINALKIKKNESTELMFVRKNGSTTHTKVTLSKVFNKSKQAVRITGSIVDISKEKTNIELNKKLNLILQAINETQLNFFNNEKSHESLSYLLEIVLSITQSKFGFIGEVLYKDEQPYIKTHALSNLAWSPESEKYYAESYSEGMEFFNLQTLFGNTLTSGEITISNHPATDPRSGGTPDGHPPIERFLGIPIIKDGELLGMMGLANKQSDYSRADAEYLAPVCSSYANMIKGVRFSSEKRKVEDQYRIVSENTDDLVFIQGPDLELTFISPSVTKALGRKPEEVIGKIPTEIFKSLNPEVTKYDDMFRSIFEINHAAYGKQVVMETLSKPTYDSQNKLTGYVSTGRDVTDREMLLKQLKDSLEKEKDLNQLKSRFISMASHEFRTPLATILSSGEILSFLTKNINQEDLRQKFLTHVERIAGQTKRLGQVISDILLLEKNYSNNEKVESELFYFPIFFNHLLKEYFPFALEQNRISPLRFSADFQIRSNQALLTHILKNLIENALKYSSESGKAVEFFEKTDKAGLQLKIKDYGIGIPESDQRYLFDSFFRGKNISNIKGTGLGLNIVKEFSEKIGIHVALKSQLGHGTEVTVNIPYEN